MACVLLLSMRMNTFKSVRVNNVNGEHKRVTIDQAN
jgi:hypothetical protein